MKALHLSLAALAAFGIASCSSDLEPQTGETDGTVTVNVSLPTAFASRAYGDGNVAKQLSYAVYDAGKLIYGTGMEGSSTPVTVDNNNFTLQLQLLKHREYEFVFWADAATDSPYTFDPTSGEVTVKKDATMTLNDDSRDAFFQHMTYTIDATNTIEAELRRPFAQLNIATGDLDKYHEHLAGVKKGRSETITVTVKNVHDALNLRTGIASGSTSFTASASWLKDNKITIGEKEYDLLSMNYILTGTDADASNVQEAQQEIFDVSIDLMGLDGMNSTVTTTGVPFRRNYRTNIYGLLLSLNANVSVECIPDFYDFNYNMTQDDIDHMDVETAEQLATAIKNSKVKTIKLLNDITSSTRFDIDANCGEKEIDLDGHTITFNKLEEIGGMQKNALTIVNTNVTLRNGKIVDKTFVNRHPIINVDHHLRTGEESASLTLEDIILDEYTKYNNTIAANRPNTVVTIKSGTYKAGIKDCLFDLYGATIVIEGGEFDFTELMSSHDGIDIDENGGGEVVVKGGTWIGLNPADYQSKGTNYNSVPEGYQCVPVEGKNNTWQVGPAE